MLVYIFKSVACLAIFFVFYTIFLEKENMHVFKRFYLLASLLLSLVIPAIVFTEYVETPAITSYNTGQHMAQTHEMIGVPPALEADILDIEPILWAIYFFGLLFFGLKFIRNLFQIFGRIRRNPKHRLVRFTQVLLKEKIAPHTFFSYIFLNKKKLESNEIPKEVLLHEETHAQQKHSIDVVIVELLQVILWVNPFIYFTKKSIKLNHEFLADQAVLKNNVDQNTYQNTLLSYLSTDSEKKYQPLANAINYSSIKKRFTVMKTHTSKKAVLLRSLLLLPLLAILLYGFSQRTIEEIKSNKNNNSFSNGIGIDNNEEDNSSLETVWIEIKNENEIWFKDESTKLEDLALRISSTYRTTAGENNFMVQIHSTGVLRSDFINKITLEVRKAGAKNVQVFTGEYNMTESEYQDEIDITPETILLKANKISLTQDNENISVNINKKGQLLVQDELVALDDLKDFLSKINVHLSTQEKQNVIRSVIYVDTETPKNIISEVNQILTDYGAATINIVGPNHDVNQKGATREQVIQFNTLAQKYNRQPKVSRRIPIKDLKVLESIYGKMSEKQKTDAQPFPECPQIDKPLQDGASRELMSEYNVLAKKYNTMLSKSGSIHIKKKDVDRLEHIYGLMSDKQKAAAVAFPDFPEPPPPPKAPIVKKGEKSNIPPPPAPKAPIVKKGEKSDIPPPPTPPEPKSPLDHVIDMAKKGATFYYEGKKVTSDKAIELLKENENLNIQSTGTSSKSPKVKISTSPIILKKSKSPKSLETGNIEIDGEEGFYSIRSGVTSYFNSNGEQVDKNGSLLAQNSKKNPKIYYNGEEITSVKANRLLSRNKSLQVASKDYDNGSYAIVLNDINSSLNLNVNRNNNPNATIDLTEMITKEALFFYNDKPITTEKAQWLTQNSHIERVNTIESKEGKLKVYFWNKA